VIPKEEVVSYARRFGITTPIEAVDAIALGTEEVIPLELTSAFSVFANRGVRVEPVAILRVEDKDGNILEEAIPRRRDVINGNTAYIMNTMLQDVITHSRGTGHAATWKYDFYRPAAGKTGTTNDYRNTWFVGYTPQICTGVWVGLDDERISLGENQTGAATALPVWAPFMREAHDTLGLPPVESGCYRAPLMARATGRATILPREWYHGGTSLST
jgi:penicillin-binding protein 1A